MNIITQIAKEFTSRNINLVYVYLPTSIDETYVLPAALTGGTANGMIVLNVYNQRLLHLLAEGPGSPRSFWIRQIPYRRRS